MARNWRDVAAGYAQQPPSLESLFRVDLTQPEQESGLARFGKGALIGTRMAGRGLKGLFQDLTPEDEFELELMRRYLEKAGLPAQAGQMAAEVPQYLAGAELGPANLLGRAATAGLTAAATSPENRLEKGLLAAGGSAAAEGTLGGLSRLIRGPVATEEARALYAEGVKPTIGQAMGGMAKTMEEKAESLPLMGQAIAGAHRRGMESFNSTVLRKIVDDLNRGITENAPGAELGGRIGPALQRVELDSIKPGAEGFKEVKQAVKGAYDRLVENTSGELTPELKAGLQGVRSLAQTMRKDYRDQINRVMQHSVLSRFKPGQRIDGVTIKEIDSELNQLADKYAKSSIADERRVGDAINEIQAQIRRMMEAQNPNYRQLLRNADSAWWKLKQVERATTSSVGNDLMTPAQLLQSLRAKNRAGFATGDMPLQTLGRNAQEVLGNKYPDSGTAGRVGLADLLATGMGGLPGAASAYFGAKGAYSPSVQDFLVNQAVRGPGPLRAGTARGLEQLRRPASAIGAVFATD